MKTLKIVTLVTLFISLGVAVQAQTGSISLTITQVQTEKGGLVKIGVFDAKGFPIVGQEIAGINITIEGASVSHLFNGIPVGIYAISVFQDKNSDGEINKNFFGAPNEPYGFSTNQYGMFGPPDFADVSFEVKEGKPVSLTINLE